MDEETMILLFQKIVKGDEMAFQSLFKKYSHRLYHLAFYYLCSKEVSEEVVLDVFTVLWNKRESLSHVKDLERYLYVSIKNQALHYIRRGRVEKGEPLSLYEVELLQEDSTPEKRLIDSEYESLVQSAVNSLPPKCKEVFRLVLSDKLKNREIADLLGISEKTVNEHISQAYKRISVYVKGQYKYSKNL